MALGYAGLAMLGVQFALTARFRRATAPFGIDIVYYFHRYLAVFALAVIVGHYVMLRALHPEVLGSANPMRAPDYMTAGRVALVLFTLVVAIALVRKRIALEYDRWRLAHAMVATLAFGLALWHLHGAGRLPRHRVEAVAVEPLWRLLDRTDPLCPPGTSGASQRPPVDCR